MLITSDTGIIDQSIHSPKRLPSFLYGNLNCGSIGADVQLHSYGSNTIRTPHHPRLIDLIAERLEAVNPPSSGNNSAAGLGQVETKFSA